MLAIIYSQLKFYDKSLEYNKKTLAIAQKHGFSEAVKGIIENMSGILYDMGKPAEALAIIDNQYHYKPGKECETELSSIYLTLYLALKKYEKAKPYYESLIHCKGEEYTPLEDKIVKYQTIIRYLIETGQAGKSYIYMDTLRNLANGRNNTLALSEIEKIHFQADSARGNYLGAIAHFSRYKSLSDSIFNSNSTKQMADLQLKYETDKKEKNIKLLNSQNQLIRIKSGKAQRSRNITLIGAALLLVIVGLLYYLYRTKQKANRKLEAHQHELDQKNEFLETLNIQQDRLIKEKEWLIKEVHHRVKNNLQMVTGLLYSQSMYLQDDAAKLAVKDSLRRMQAMALIHQKLYQDENTSTIAMPEYINDLLHYLRESFDVDQQIAFRQNIDPILLDVSQAIPLGLIITESIVNAIKYAFINQQKGVVDIVLQHDGTAHLLLKIADNGMGLPEAFDSSKTHSLGLDLIKGLSKQLNGTMTIENREGVHITVRFAIFNK
ncbi:sensor histidine kinase [Flavobacterium sp.]|uniref:sensor histidine kinase n=1 Tax=Flavobacterium sp. TaxID=239 RepID=UPI0039E3A064